MYRIKRTFFVAAVLASLIRTDAVSADVGNELIELSGIQGGLVVVLNNEQITSEIRINNRYLVQGLFEDAKSGQAARQRIQAKGIYGPVTVRSWKGEELPYLDNMVNLIVASGKSKVAGDEFARVLAPRGVLLTPEPLATCPSSLIPQTQASKDWYAYKKAVPSGIDEWTHWMHAPNNNAVSKDTYKDLPRGLQWIQPPRWWKGHELAPPFSAMVSAKGRLFYIADESLPGISGMPDRWFLIARDAFNGTLLWKKPIKEWGGKYWKETYIDGRMARLENPNQVLRRLVAVDDKVFVTLGLFAPISMLDAATGEVLNSFKGTENAFEILVEQDRMYLAINAGLKNSKSGPDISIMAVDIPSGKIRWRSDGHKGTWETSSLAPQFVDAHITLGKEGLFFIDQQEIIALDLLTGGKKWAISRFGDAGSSGKRGAAFERSTLTYHDSVLFYCHKSNVSLLAVKADSGKQLWVKKTGSIAYHASPDILVTKGLVWVLNTGEWTYEGLDPRTGEKKQTMDMSLIKSGTHHNCYRNKATQNFILYGRNKGIEYFNINDNESKRVNWIKGACRYGIMPANGMIYLPSHFCTCNATSKMNGIVAIGNTGITDAKTSTADQVIQGPAYGKKLRTASGKNDWPTYRQNIARTGFQPTLLSDKLKVKWASKLKGNLTPPVIADGKVFVASKDDHRVICLNADNGNLTWTFLPEGKVDSPPSYSNGRLVFGGRDGFVYCLDAATGELAWRFRAAPADRQMGAFGQVESAWPVFGTLLVHDNKVYCTAGRHSNVNSGIYLYQLDIHTGQPLRSVHHIPDISEQGEMDTAVNVDILVGDGNIMHLRGMVFDMKTLEMIDKGKRFVERPAVSRHDPMDTNLIMALGGFLEDSFFNGSFWYYNGKYANILALDSENLYSVNIYSKNSFKSSSHANFYPGQATIQLVASGLKKAPAHDSTGQPGKKGKKNDSDKGGNTTFPWTSTLPVKAKSLLIGSDNLYLAGVLDKVDSKDPWAHFDGRMGGLITIHSKADGKLKQQIELQSPPVFDGLASADNRLFVSCKDGSVLCLE